MSDSHMKKQVIEILKQEANIAETNRKFHIEHGDKYNLAYYFLAQKDLLRKLKRRIGNICVMIRWLFNKTLGWNIKHFDACVNKYFPYFCPAVQL